MDRYTIGDMVVRSIVTRSPTTGEAADADSDPVCYIYDATDHSLVATVPAEAVAGTVGFYSVTLELTTGGGFDTGNYVGHISATVDGVNGLFPFSFSLSEGVASTGDWTPTERAQIRYRLGLDGIEEQPSTGGDMTANVWRELLSAGFADGTSGQILQEMAHDIIRAGLGAVEVIYRISEPDEDAITGADVWVTADSEGEVIVARGITNSSGEVTIWLDPGNYYSWRQKNGYLFTNPTPFTVPAPP